jgi:hypothetical protein
MKPTPQDVLKALPHVRYEIESLLLTPEHDPSNSALRESVFFRKMAHGRLLYTFFTRSSCKPNERNPDDVVSEDFGFGPEALYGDKPKALLDQFNKRLFHLTYSRMNYDDEWLMDKCLLPVMRQSRRFIEHILGVATIPMEDEELRRWRDLKEKDSSKAPLVQNTSNVADYQVHAIDLHPGT